MRKYGTELDFYSSLTDFEKSFLDWHYLRLESLLSQITQFAISNFKILNVGLSVFDLMVRQKFRESKDINYKVAVPQLGFGKSNIYKDIDIIEIDLCMESESNLEFINYFDLVIFSGVLEHLFCDDRIVLKNISKILRKSGILILTAPNAASFVNRIRILNGKNIHWSKSDILGGTEFGGYGHIREYTKKELETLGDEYFDVVKFVPVNNYRLRGINFSYFNHIIPVSWSIDIEVIYRKK